MGKRNKTQITIIRIIGIIYFSFAMIIQVMIPFFVHSDSVLAKLSLEINYMTYCICAAIFSSFSVLYLLVYLVSAIAMIVSYIGILRRKYNFYLVPIMQYAIDIVFTFFNNSSYYFIGISIKIVFIIIFLTIIKTKKIGNSGGELQAR